MRGFLFSFFYINKKTLKKAFLINLFILMRLTAFIKNGFFYKGFFLTTFFYIPLKVGFFMRTFYLLFIAKRAVFFILIL